ncbi:MAG: hypothetical protein Q4C47_04790, partial [Planctomycetia bacterium]|nr:hypothetical protein [Planctomycetia bacterium]
MVEGGDTGIPGGDFPSVTGPEAGGIGISGGEVPVIPGGGDGGPDFRTGDISFRVSLAGRVFRESGALTGTPSGAYFTFSGGRSLGFAVDSRVCGVVGAGGELRIRVGSVGAYGVG